MLLLFTTALLGSTLTAGAADEPQKTAFTAIVEHYENVRQALYFDTTEGIAASARDIGDLVAGLESSWGAAAAGVTPEHAEATRELLPEVAAAASDLAEATDLAAARDAFYALTKPLVRYRFGVSGERPMVVYCPMAKRSWLQPRGDLGNPYHGQAMGACGEIVEEK